MVLLSEHRSCRFQFRIALSQRDPMRRTKRFFQIFAELLIRMNSGLRSGVLSPIEEQSL